MHIVFAYIDPGAGSLLIQAAIAALVAIPIFFRTQIRRVIGAIRGTNGQPKEQAPGPDDAAPGA